MSDKYLSPLVPFADSEIYGDRMIVDEANFGAMQAGSFPFKGSRFIVKPGQTSDVDHHEVKECWFIASGKGSLLYKGELKMNLSQGDILFYDSFQSHQITNTGIDDLLIFSVWWK